MNTIDVNGEWPSIEGKILQEMFCVEMYYEGQLEETANITFLKVEDKWLRLYFDCEIVFWRYNEPPSESCEMPEHKSYFKNRDVATELGFKSEKITSLELRNTNPGVDIEFKFENEKNIILYDIHDKSNFRT